MAGGEGADEGATRPDGSEGPGGPGESGAFGGPGDGRGGPGGSGGPGGPGTPESEVVMHGARARVLADLAARDVARAPVVSLLERAVSERRWWLSQWPDGAAYVPGLLAQDMQDALMETHGRWPLCPRCAEPHALAVEPELGADPHWVCEARGEAVAAVGSLGPAGPNGLSGLPELPGLYGQDGLDGPLDGPGGLDGPERPGGLHGPDAPDGLDEEG